MTTTRGALVSTAVLALAACDNSGFDLGFPAEKTNTVVAIAFLDRDGSRTITLPTDTTFAGARIALLQRGSGDTLRTVLTDTRGVARFTNVTLGDYRIAVAPGSIGDSLQVAGIDSANIRVARANDTTIVVVRLSYPEVTLRQARALPPGRRVFVRGIILAGVQSFRDTTSHAADSSGAIRMTRVVLRGGLTGNTPGDSVSALGYTSSRLGQPTLDQAIISRFGTRPPPLPSIIGSGTAATASGGTLDAALVQVVSAIISDTVTVTPDFKVVASDGSGSFTVILDANINFVRSIFRLGRPMSVRGVLVPDGQGGWSLKPREVADAVVF